MSGLETVKIIVDAERQAAKIIEDATTQAANIRRGIEPRIQMERQKTLADARKEATSITAHAEEEGKLEAERYEKESVQTLRDVVTKASAKKEATVDKLVTIILQVDK